MKKYLLSGTTFHEITETEFKSYKPNEYIEAIWEDLEGNKIILLNKNQKSINDITQKLIWFRFANLNTTKSKILQLVLFLWILMFASWFFNYKWQVGNYEKALEQCNTEKTTLLNQKTTNITAPVVNTKPNVWVVEKKEDNIDNSANSLIDQNNKLSDELDKITYEKMQSEQDYKWQISILNERLNICKESIPKVDSKTELQIYQELEKNFTDKKREELKQIMRYEYLDEARKLAQQYCSKLK